LALGVLVGIRWWGSDDGDSWVYEQTGTRDVLGNGWAMTLVTDGEVVCGSTPGSIGRTEGQLFCLDPVTGKERFRAQLGIAVTPLTLVDGTVLVWTTERPEGSGELRAYSLDGDQRWAVPLNGLPPALPHRIRLPVAGDGVLAAIDRRGDGAPRELVGVDVSTGEERWRVSDPDHPMAFDLYVFGDGERFYATRAGEVGHRIVAVDPASGSELWRSAPVSQTVGVTINAAVAFEDGTAMAFAISGANSKLVVLEAATGRLLWDADVLFDPTQTRSSLAHVDDVTVVISDDGEMTGYDRAGTQLWTRSVDESDQHSLIVQDGVLYHAGPGLSTVDPRSGVSQVILEGGTLEAGAVVETSDGGIARDLGDVVVVGDRLVVGGLSPVEGFRLDDLQGAG
jgi:outer membrane protein assembly factor BamB